tara:strand:+ start:901 stop:1950 length:1050 start_codon:yes stop_codon:yes gene_type:complete
MSVSITDHDSNGLLTNYCYDNCDNNSNSELKISRGLIYKDNKPFIKSFGYTPEFTINNIDDETKNYIITNFDNLRFFYSLEGTLLRLYWNDVNNKWYISTHKKLDARNSRWGSRYTFGEIIDTILPKSFYDTLDKQLCYLFILTPNQDNRIVCNTFLNQLFHVGTYDSQFNLTYDYDIKIQKPVELGFNSLDHLISSLNDDSFPCYSHQGILICDVQSQRNIKLLNNTYNELRNVRGNTPSILFRYLEIRMDENKKSNLKMMFPTHLEGFNIYEELIHTISRKLFNEYMNRYIKHNFKQISPSEHHILKQCHNWHHENKSENKMSKDKIYEIINKQPATLINSLIKLYR